MKLPISWLKFKKVEICELKFKINEKNLEKFKLLKDLGIHLSEEFFWNIQVNDKMRKANINLYLPQLNLLAKVGTFVKLGQYKSLTLPNVV